MINVMIRDFEQRSCH